MYTFLIIIHVLAAILLIAAVLIQRGRGGGLVESFSGVESMFGTKTSAFLTRITVILAAVFLLTSISLALMAAHRTRSLIDEEEISTMQQEPIQKDIEEDIQPKEKVSVSAVEEQAAEVKKPIEQSPAPDIEVQTVQE